MADGDGIVGEALNVVGDVAGAVGGELKKFGQSVTSQVIGSGSTSAPTASKQPSAITDGDDAGSGVVGEFKKLVQTAGSQVIGQAPTLEAGQIAKMAKKDEEFSTHEAAAIRARINQIYQEHAAKRVHEKQQMEMAEKQQEEVKEEQEKEIKKEETNTAIQKTRAEIKNYGAE